MTEPKRAPTTPMQRRNAEYSIINAKYGGLKNNLILFFMIHHP